MAALTNTQISVTYVGLLKTSASTVLSSTAQQMTDGAGNNSILYLSTAEVGIGGSPTAGKELDVTGNVLITGDLQVDNININGNTISATSGVVTLQDGTIATTQSQDDNSTKVATTAYVDTAVDGVDELSEVLANGNTTGGTNIDVSAGDDINLTDTSEIHLGDSADLVIKHNGSLGTIQNNTGNLQFVQNTDDGDIKFFCDDGAGGTENYLQIDGGEQRIKVFNEMRFNDSVELRLGTGNDLRIYHNSTNSLIQNFNGDLEIRQTADDSDIKLMSDDSSGGIANYVVCDGSTGAVKLSHYGTVKLETTSSGVSVTGNITIPAGNKLRYSDNSFMTPENNTSGAEISTAGTFIVKTGTTPTLGLTVDASQNATFAGNATIETGINLESGVLVIKNATGDSSGLRIFQDSSDASKIYNNFNGTLQLGVGNTTALTINSSENAIFASDVGLGGTGLYTNSASLNIDGTGLAIKNDTAGNSNNWSIIKNTATASTSNLVFVTGGGTILTLNHDTSATFSGNITFGATNPFQQGTNVLDGTGSDGARIRSAVSSAANPTFSNSDDTNTGMFFAAADTLGFTTGGSERMRIASDGVTTISPQNNTSGQRTSKFDSFIIKTDYNGGDGQPYTGFGGGLIFNNETYSGTFYDSAAIYGGIGDDSVSTTVGGHLAFYTSNTKTDAPTEKMRLDSSGNLNIIGRNSGAGNTSMKLIFDNTDVTAQDNQLIGGIEWHSDDGSGAGAGIKNSINSFFTGTGGYAEMIFSTSGTDGNNTERMRITSAGKLGIATNSPNALLEISGINENQIRLTSSDTTAAADETIGGIEFYSSDSGNEGVKGSISAIAAGSAGSAYMTFSTGQNTEVLRIESDGDILHTDGNLTMSGATPFITLSNTAETESGITLVDSADPGQSAKITYDAGDNKFRFKNNSSNTRMTINSSGNVGINDDSPDTAALEVVNIASDEYTGSFDYEDTDGTVGVLKVRLSGGSTSPSFVDFIYGTSQVGSITTTGSATVYLTSSDYRLKENVVELTGALDRLDNLQPKRFNFTSTPDQTLDGFLAHEVSDYVPEAIEGTKDETYQHKVSDAQDAVEWTDKPTLDNTKAEIQAWLDENNIEWQSADTKQELLDRIPEYQQEAQDAVYETRPKYQGIDQSKLVPLLVAAVKELKARIEILENS